METLMCAALGTARRQNGLEACTVYGDRTVCSCRYSKTSALVRSMYCVWRLLLCAAVGTARHQHWLEAHNVYGDCTVCSCKYSKTSALIRSM